MAKGGLTNGPSHARGGIKMTVKDTGQQIEVEGGEGIINKHVMSSDKKVSYKGKKMTPCEIASDLNQTTGNGVGFDCAETKNTDMTPTDPNTGFATGGYVEFSDFVPEYDYAKGGQVTCPNCSTDFFAEGGEVNSGNDLLKIDAKFRKVTMPKPISYDYTSNTAYSPKNKQLMDALSPIASTDDLRPAMTGVYFDRQENYIAVTNAHILMRMNYPLPHTNNKGKVVSGTENGIYATDKSLKKEYKRLSKNLSRDEFLTFDEWKKKFPSYLTIDAKYPNYNQVIPEPTKDALGSNVDIRKLYWYSSVLLKAKSKGDSILKENKFIYFQITNPSTKEKQLVGFNAKYVQTITKAIIQLQNYWSNHNTDLMFPYYYIGEQKPFCLFMNINREKVYQHKGDGNVGLIMPMQMDYRGTDILLNDDLKDLPMNLIYDCDTNTILSNGKYYEIDASVGYGKTIKTKSAPKKQAEVKLTRADIQEQIDALCVALEYLDE